MLEQEYELLRLRGGHSLSPRYRPCVERDDNVLPFEELSHFGGARKGGGETSVGVHPGNEYFLEKSHYSDMIADIVTTLSLSCDERLRPRWEVSSAV